MIQQTVSITLTINVLANLQIITQSLPAATVGKQYSELLIATGGVAPYSWTAQGLPPGLNLTPGGVLIGIPQVAGSYSPTITVTDAGQ
jgi:hypothetical protein